MDFVIKVPKKKGAKDGRDVRGEEATSAQGEAGGKGRRDQRSGAVEESERQGRLRGGGGGTEGDAPRSGSPPRPAKGKPGTKKRLRGKGQGVTEKKVERPRGSAAAVQAGGKKDKTRRAEEIVFDEDDEGGAAGAEEGAVNEAGGDREGSGTDGEGEGRTPAPKAKERGEEDDPQEWMVEGDQDEQDQGQEEERGTDQTQEQEGDAPRAIEAVSRENVQDAGAVEVEATNVRRLPVLSQGGDFDLKKVQKLLKAIPGLACSTCTIGPECPEFKEGFVCAFRKAFSAFNMSTVEGVLAGMRHVVQTNMERLQFALTEERIVSGGHPDQAVTALTETVMRQAKALVDMDRDTSSVKVRVVGTGSKGAPAAVEAGARAGRSILETLFRPPDPVPQVIGTDEKTLQDQRSTVLGTPQNTLIEVSLHPDGDAEGAERTQDTRGADEERTMGGRDESDEIPVVEVFDTQG